MAVVLALQRLHGIRDHILKMKKAFKEALKSHGKERVAEDRRILDDARDHP